MRGLLDAELEPSLRKEHLQKLCDQFTGRPLEAITVSLREAIAESVSMEDFWRLNIFISHLCNQCGASIPLNRKLRAEVHASFARRGEPAQPEPEPEEGGDHHVLPE